MNKIAKTVLMTGTALCVAGVVLSTAGYFAGGKDFTYTSDHMYVSGGNSSSRKNLTVMKKEQIDDFTKLNVDFEDFDLDIPQMMTIIIWNISLRKTGGKIL